MKRIFLLIILFFNSITDGKCDTITNWQVYHNRHLIQAINYYSKLFTLKLHKTELTINDTLFLIVNECSVNPNENVSIEIMNDNNEKILELNNRNTYFTLNKINNSDSKKFEVFYYFDKKKFKEKILLFKIEIN